MPDATIEDADSTLELPSGEAPPAAPRGRMPRILDWFSCLTELRRARAAVVLPTAEQTELLRRARLALDVGDRVLEPLNEPSKGTGAAHAAELFRQALHWACAAANASKAPGAEQEQTLSTIARLDPEQLGDAQRLLSLDEPFVFFADMPADEQRTTAAFLRGCALGALQQLEAPQQAVVRLQALRLIRLATVPLAGALVAVTVLALWPEKPDIARNKPWQASSALAQCNPEQAECAGTRTLIRFHTKYQDNPWFEYDMQAPVQFSSMTIRNRGDGNSERAVPLIVEVSDDRQTYREIARKKSDFSVWRPSFPAQQARYVRLRVPRSTFLHLEEVQVHP